MSLFRQFDSVLNADTPNNEMNENGTIFFMIPDIGLDAGVNALPNLLSNMTNEVK